MAVFFCYTNRVNPYIPYKDKHYNPNYKTFKELFINYLNQFLI